MEENDKMHITVRNIDKAEVWISQVSDSNGYVSENRDLQVQGTEEFRIPKGQKIYISVWATDETFDGNYLIESWIDLETSQEQQSGKEFTNPLPGSNPEGNPNIVKEDASGVTENESLIVDFIVVNDNAVQIQEDQIKVIKIEEEEQKIIAEILPGNSESYTLWIILGIVAFVFLILILVACIFFRSRQRKKIEE